MRPLSTETDRTDLLFDIALQRTTSGDSRSDSEGGSTARVGANSMHPLMHFTIKPRTREHESSETIVSTEFFATRLYVFLSTFTPCSRVTRTLTSHRSTMIARLRKVAFRGKAIVDDIQFRGLFTVYIRCAEGRMKKKE